MARADEPRPQMSTSLPLVAAVFAVTMIVCVPGATPDTEKECDANAPVTGLPETFGRRSVAERVMRD